jgi:hypothetical protein
MIFAAIVIVGAFIGFIYLCEETSFGAWLDRKCHLHDPDDHYIDHYLD